MYCKDCGKKIVIVGTVPSECPNCGREITLGPKWVSNALFVLMAALVLGVAAIFGAMDLNVQLGAGIGLALGIVAFFGGRRALLAAGVLHSDQLVDELPKELEGSRPSDHQPRKLDPMTQVRINLAQVDLPEGYAPDDPAALRVAQALRERDEGKADGRGAQPKGPTANTDISAGSATPADADRPHALLAHRNTYDEVRGTDDAGIAEMSALATSIVKEHFDPIIGPEQNDYMIGLFNTEDAIRSQIQDQGYRYFFVNDPLASASASAAERHVGFVAFYRREGGELYLSKFYLAKDAQGRGLSRDMMAFVRDSARELGCDRVSLNVNRTNYQAILAYEHLGMTKVREEKNSIGHGYYMDDFVYELRV